MRINKLNVASIRQLTARLPAFSRTKTFRITSGVIVATVIALVVFQSAVNAGTAVLVPNADVSASWTPTGSGGSTCAATHCDLVDESYTAPDVANYVTAPATALNEEFGMSTFTFPAGVTTINSLKVRIYADAVTVLKGADTITLSLSINSYASPVTITPTAGSYGWSEAIFSGSWTQTQIDGMQVRMGRTITGSGSATDTIRVATVYTEATYVTPMLVNQSAYRWFTTAQTPLQTQDTSTVAPTQGSPFRLRLLLGMSTYDLPQSAQTFKLQYAPRSGTCDTSFSGETYTDISNSSGDIRFYNDPVLTDGQAAASTIYDPTYLGHTNNLQTFSDLPNFTNAISSVPAGQEGLWDFSLVDYSATGGSSYCFRAVKLDNGVLNTYTSIPEITTAPEPDSGVQYASDHTTKIPLGGTNIPSGVSSMFLDFTKLAGSTNQYITPQAEVQNTTTGFTGTANYNGSPVSTTSLTPNLRTQSCSAYDSTAKRMVIFGGQGVTTATHYNDTWALNLPKNGLPSWSILTANGAGGSPAIRRGCMAIYDSTLNRFIIFAGRISGGTTVWYNDVWSLSLGSTPTWTQLCTASSCGTAPGTRTASGMIYDSVGNQIIIFGGYNGTVFSNDMWKLTLGGSPAWTSLTPTGGPPLGRAGHSFELDPVNRLGWLVAGTTSTIDLNDTWKYNIAANTWTQMFANNCTGTCPKPLEGTTMAYDPVNQQMVLFGGHNWGANAGFTAGASQVTSILSNLATSPTWSTPAIDSPLAHQRYYSVSDYDPQNQRMIVFAGEDATIAPNGVNKDLSALYLPSGGATPYWRGVATNVVMNGRDQTVPYYDSTNKYAYIFGGFANGTLPQTDTTGTHVSETFRLDLTTSGRAPRWRNVSGQDQTNGTTPLAREAEGFANDTLRKRLIVFGGLNEENRMNDVWTADMSDPSKDPAWSQLCSPTSCGTAPPVRWLTMAVYDSIGDRFIVFGGESSGAPDYNDVWSLSLNGTPTWTQLTPTGTPPAIRQGGAVVFDAPNNRMVLYGGVGDNGSTINYNDVWALSLGGSPAWTALSPTGTPPTGTGRRSMTYALSTSGSNKLVIFGGYGQATSVHYNDVMALDLSTTNGAWSTLFANNCSDSSAPACRRSQSGVYDSVGNRLITFTGRDNAQFYNDAYSFNLTTNTWTNLSPVNEIRLSVPVTGLADDAYHWQYRTTGSVSGAGSYISYGGNSDTINAAVDFASCGPPTVDKRMRQGTYFCGLAKQNKILPN